MCLTQSCSYFCIGRHYLIHLTLFLTHYFIALCSLVSLHIRQQRVRELSTATMPACEGVRGRERKGTRPDGWVNNPGFGLPGSDASQWVYSISYFYNSHTLHGLPLYVRVCLSLLFSRFFLFPRLALRFSCFLSSLVPQSFLLFAVSFLQYYYSFSFISLFFPRLALHFPYFHFHLVPWHFLLFLVSSSSHSSPFPGAHKI